MPQPQGINSNQDERMDMFDSVHVANKRKKHSALNKRLCFYLNVLLITKVSAHLCTIEILLITLAFEV